MRICLIYPPFTAYGTTYGIRPGVSLPLGLAYIAAVLDKEHEVSVIDAPAEGWRNFRTSGAEYHLGLRYEEITSKVKKLSPDVIGITVTFTQGSGNAFKIAQAVKSIKKDIIVILGGVHPSVRPIDCLEQPGVDFVVIGEGEHTIMELIHVLEQGRRDELRNVKGIAYLEDGKQVITSPRPLIEDLDSLPFPAWHLFPMDAYFEAIKGGVAPRTQITKPWATISTSRGCPYNCVFCAVHTVLGRKYRTRSPQNVIQELETLVATYGIKQLDILDDNLTLDRRRVEQILDLMIERQLGIEWFTSNGVRADTLDENILMKMKRAGCKNLWLSPESGVQRVVDSIIKKRQDLKKVEEVVAICKKIGLKVDCYFVLGLIGETKEDMLQTIEYARKLKRMGANRISPSIVVPYYGTQLYEEAKQKGFLRKGLDQERMSRSEGCIETPEFTAEELQNLRIQVLMVDSLWHPEFFSLPVVARAIRNPRLSLNFVLLAMDVLRRKVQRLIRPRFSVRRK